MNARWPSRSLALASLAATCWLALACGGGDSSTPTATTAPTSTPSAAPTTAGTATPPYEGSLHVGDWVRVAGAGDCLNFRVAPATESYSPINFCQPDGFEGYVSDGPQLSEGHWWWWIAGQGWAQDDYLEFVRSEDLSARTVPELRGLGQIAYLGADGIWIMDSDGSDKRRLVDAPPPGSDTFYSASQWSPNGQRLLFGVVVRRPEGAEYSVRVVDLDGDVVAEVPDAALASWSPDGSRLGLLHGIVSEQVGSFETTPSVYDVATRTFTAVGPLALYNEGPKWRPGFSNQLAYRNVDGLFLASANGQGAPTRVLDNEDAGWVVNWSPDGRLLSLTPASGCAGYFVYDIGSAGLDRCVPAPAVDDSRGGRDGTSEDGQTDWSPDGRLFAYHTEWAAANGSGVYVVDVTIGEQTLLPAWAAQFTSFAPDSEHVVFETHGAGRSLIWVGDASTGDVTLLAEGSQPAWRPVN